MNPESDAYGLKIFKELRETTHVSITIWTLQCCHNCIYRTLLKLYIMPFRRLWPLALRQIKAAYNIQVVQSCKSIVACRRFAATEICFLYLPVPCTWISANPMQMDGTVADVTAANLMCEYAQIQCPQTFYGVLLFLKFLFL